jgi:hypothetical protein
MDHKPLVTTLSCVTAPILLRQQQHLAFFSKFNVQMLYLPGLESVADFCPLPLTGDVIATAAATPPSKTAAQKCSVCSAIHPSLLLFAKQALSTWLAMSLSLSFKLFIGFYINNK